MYENDDKNGYEVNIPTNICRCCLGDGCYKDISTDYFWLGQTENYESILKDTFDISITYQNGSGPSSQSRLICEGCITKLRDAATFKKRVLDSERDFASHLESLHTKSKHCEAYEIKVEKDDIAPLLEDHADSFNDIQDFDSETAFEDDKLLSNIKLESTQDDDSDFDLKTLKLKYRAKRKGLSGKTTKSRTKKLKDLKEETEEVAASRKKKKSAKGRKPRLHKEIERIPRSDDKEIEEEKKSLKENTLNLILNSNICLFRHNRTRFKCFFCNDTFTSMCELRCHTDTNHTDKEVSWKVKALKLVNLKKIDVSDLKCKLCDNPCKGLDSLKAHLTEIHKILFHRIDREIMVPYCLSGSQMNNVTCEICNEEFKAFNKLAIHMNTHFQNNVCDICGVGFPNLSGLKQHKRNLHRNIVCKICNQVFTSSSKMQRHRIKDHKVVPRRKCPFCEATFRYSEKLYLHKIEAHGFERTEFKCNYCDKVFLIEYTLKSHIKAAHFRQKKHLCDKCDMTFYSNYELTRHLNTTHVTEKNVLCSLCNAKYKCVSSLRRHLKSAVHRHM